MRKPDFQQLIKVLKCEKPDRPTLFEFFMNDDVYKAVVDKSLLDTNDKMYQVKLQTFAFANLGYDYVTLIGSNFNFNIGARAKSKTVSMNEGSVITDWDTFSQFKWNHPCDYDYSAMKNVETFLPDGMRVIGHAPGGVLENTVELMGYENLCLLLYDDRPLVKNVVDKIGESLLEHYKILLDFPSVGAIISNDDWGFNTQTMLATEDMREFIFPWHKKIVDLAHAKGKPVILHSCGNFSEIWEDTIELIGFDGKHSYEDKILSVEDSYEKYKGRIAIMGGIDLDFICRSAPEEITARSVAMLERAADIGGYALGTGNSVPSYVPMEHYFSMLKAIELVK